MESIEVTNSFNHFKWMLSNEPKVIQNNKLDILHIRRLWQKQPIGGVPFQPGYNGKPCDPKIFKANQIAWFLYTKFLRKGLFYELIFCIAVHHHDWNLGNKFWLLVAYGFLSKMSIKVKLMFFKVQKRNSFINMQTWNDRNVNPKVTYKNYIQLIHFFSFFTFDNNLVLSSSLDTRWKKPLEIGFCLSFYIF